MEVTEYIHKIVREIDRRSNAFNSRTDIDRYLIEQGFDPASIDTAWQERQRRAENPTFKVEYSETHQKLAFVGVIGLIVSLTVMGIVIFNPFKASYTWWNAPLFDETVNKSELEGVAFSPNGKYLSVSNRNGQIFLWQMPERKLLTTIQPINTRNVDRPKIFWSSDSTLIAVSNDKELTAWSTETGERIINVESSMGALSPDGKTLVIHSKTDNNRFELDLLDVVTHKLDKRINIAWSKGQAMDDLAFTPDGKFLVGRCNKQVWFYDRETSRETFMELRTNLSGDWINNLLTPDAKYLVSVFGQTTIGFWEWGLAAVQQPSIPTNVKITDKHAFSTDGKYLAGIVDSYPRPDDGVTIKIYSTSDFQVIGKTENFTRGEYIKGVNFSPDGQKLVAITHSSIYMWNLADLVKAYKK